MSGQPLSGTNDDLARPPLRYRRFGGGYRRDDVDLLLAELRLTLRAFELELSGLRERSRELEGRLRDARGEIDSFHAKGYELARAMSTARERAAQIEREAGERSEAVVAQAEAEAARRIAEADAAALARIEEAEAEAARRIEAVAGPIAELTMEKERLLSEIRALVSKVGESIAGADAPDADSGTRLENGFPGVADLSGLRERARRGGEPSAEEPEPFETHVELDAGPFADIDSVANFERELSRLPNVEDVYVRRMNGERAAIDLTVAPGTPLLAEMRDKLPYQLEVRDRALDRLVIDVEVVIVEPRPS